MSIQPHPHQQLPRYLTQEEARRFFAAASDPRDRTLFALMYLHGLRVGEVLLLRRGDVDLDRGRLLVRRLKGGSWSEQVLFAAALELLGAHLARISRGPDTPLFPGRHGPLRRRQIQARFVRYRRAAGLPDRLTTHSLRHSIATHLLDAGASLEFVQDHLGHRNIRSTAIYARISDRHREALMRSLERSPWIVRPTTGEPKPNPSPPAPAS
ncbi:MAG: tyrosine-type recombinase/integrase [Candidatus Eisenbacteria bacterium]|nr:tyrosine-type recombinase/integrase [Candidatus Eisenbacteria bacterium]